MTGTGLVLLVPALLQGAAMLVDEGHFHRRRGLPPWERIGHPLDTLTAAAGYAYLAVAAPGPTTVWVFVGLSLFSCLFITKDEFVHARLCEPAEGLLHAVLFVLHPLVFLGFGVRWWMRESQVPLRIELLLTFLFLLYQLLFWSFPWKPRVRTALR